MGIRAQPTMSTTVVSVQDPESQWRSGICSCFNDCGLCVYAFFCPWCAVASARSNFDMSNFFFNLCCVNQCVVRNIVREAYNIEGTCLGDLCWPCCFGPCSAAQLLRETKSRGNCNAVTVLGADGQSIQAETKEGANAWSSGLCGCFSDCSSCCYAWWCPCCAVATASSNYDGSNFCFNCLVKNPCVAHSIIREGEYNIDGTCLEDCCAPAFCAPCAISRLLREVEVRGSINEVRHVVQVPQNTIMVQPRQA